MKSITLQATPQIHKKKQELLGSFHLEEDIVHLFNTTIILEEIISNKYFI
jgi:hypothetical protein